MAKYYSPDGNLEVWDTKPDGYYTEAEWEEMHPPTPYIPTKDEQIAALTAEYTQGKANLCEAYTTATMTGDTETAESVVAKNNLAALLVSHHRLGPVHHRHHKEL